MTKPKNETQHNMWLAENKSHPVKVPPPETFRGPNGGLYFRVPNADGNENTKDIVFYDAHVKGLDDNGLFRYGQPGRKGRGGFLKKLLKGASVLLGHVVSPQAKILASILKFNVAPAERLHRALSNAGVANRTILLSLVDEYGESKILALAEELDDALEDGKIDPVEAAWLAAIASGKVEPYRKPSPKQEPAKNEVSAAKKKKADETKKATAKAAKDKAAKDKAERFELDVEKATAIAESGKVSEQDSTFLAANPKAAKEATKRLKAKNKK